MKIIVKVLISPAFYPTQISYEIPNRKGFEKIGVELANQDLIGAKVLDEKNGILTMSINRDLDKLAIFNVNAEKLFCMNGCLTHIGYCYARIKPLLK